MGLACSQIQLLSLTRRKADVELKQSMNAMRKIALSKEMTQLSSEYNSKLKTKSLSFYNSQTASYDKITYPYLMGYGSDYTQVLGNADIKKPLKNGNSMILTDYKGQVVLSQEYANAITSVIGTSCVNNMGQGSAFESAKIPEILHSLFPDFSTDEFKGEMRESSYSAHGVNTMTGETTDTTRTVTNSDTTTSLIGKIIDFYYPIFQAAATNGWTTQYNDNMSENDNYISDAINSGIFVLTEADDCGFYKDDTSLTYYLTRGDIDARTDKDAREELTAWYNDEKNRISEKETWIDLEQQDLSTELESINAEIESINTFIQNAIQSVFNWGSNA